MEKQMQFPDKPETGNQNPVTSGNSSLSEREIADIVARGADTLHGKVDPEQIVKVDIRIDRGTLDEIDQLLTKKKPQPKRHPWLLEAIHEKLRREQSALQ